MGANEASIKSNQPLEEAKFFQQTADAASALSLLYSFCVALHAVPWCLVKVCIVLGLVHLKETLRDFQHCMI